MYEREENSSANVAITDIYNGKCSMSHKIIRYKDPTAGGR